MIILLGPDSSGKTTLQEKIIEFGNLVNPELGDDPPYFGWHAVKDTEYKDYMEVLSGTPDNPIPLGAHTFQPSPFLEKNKHAVIDRFFWCEYPYSEVLRNAAPKFSLKQFHNLHLATIAHNPVVILMTRRSEEYLDPDVPEELFVPLLQSYREWLEAFDVVYLEWDFMFPRLRLIELLDHEAARQASVIWWRNLAKRGIAGIGNTVNPQVMVIAEVLSANNIFHYPFEGGPSGQYLTDLFQEAEVPLSSFYLTNWKKTNSHEENSILLAKEITQTKIDHVIILGGEARKAEQVFLSKGFDRSNIHHLKHPGWVVNHSSSPREEKYRKEGYSREWKATWDKILQRSPAPELESSSSTGLTTETEITSSSWVEVK